MTKSPIHVERLDAAVLADIAAMSDDAGVLTVLAARGEASAVEIRSALRRHRKTFALDDVTADALAIADDRLPGTAHGLVASLSTGVCRSFPLPAPVETLVAISSRADVTPIARAVDAASLTGIVDVRHNGVRVLESGPDGARELEGIAFESGGDWSEFRGPAHAQPLRGYESSSQRELFERRVGAQVARQVSHAAAEVARTATAHGWRTALVAGDAHLAEPFRAALTETSAVDRRLPDWESAGALVGELATELAAARRAATSAVIREALAQPGRFAKGPAAVQQAMLAGATAEVLVDAVALGLDLDDLVRTALARRVAVRFADGELTELHGAACSLHGLPGGLR